VAVIGRPDHDLGEVVAAAVQVEHADAVSPAELAEHVAPLLAKFAVPAQWWITTEPLPMTDAGKPDKRALKKLWPKS
jgi:long-chain acyl-CoA synthetase